MKLGTHTEYLLPHWGGSGGGWQPRMPRHRSAPIPAFPQRGKE